MYVCGPTVYGPPHLGHGRFSLVFDVLRRYLEWTGLDVRYVSNITDIDDNIIERGQRRGPAARGDRDQVRGGLVSRRWTRIGVKRPTVDPHATAYVTRDGRARRASWSTGRRLRHRATACTSSVETIEDYGLLAHQSLETCAAGGGDRALVGEEKRDPADFALWKKAKPGEPSWDSPWGAGRPGWHTECVVMSLDLLGEGFDLHGGGQDLAFPHHENERAQAVALGRAFARHWVHNGFVEVGRREDVEVARQLHEPPRPHRARRPARVPPARAAGALPLAARDQQGHDRRRRGRHLPASTRSPGASPRRCRRRRTRRRRVERVPRRDGRRPRHARRRWPSLFDTVRQANTAARRRRRRPRRRRSRAAVLRDLPARSASCCGRDERGARRGRGARGRARTTPGPPRTGPAPTPLARRAAWPTDGSSRTPRERQSAPCLIAPWSQRSLLGASASRCPAGFGTIWTTVALDLIGFGIVLPILAAVRRALRGQRHRHRRLLVSSFSLAQLLFAPVWGRLSDRIGRKPVILISLFGTAARQPAHRRRGLAVDPVPRPHRRRRVGGQRVGRAGGGGRRRRAARAGRACSACSAQPSVSASSPGPRSAPSPRSAARTFRSTSPPAIASSTPSSPSAASPRPRPLRAPIDGEHGSAPVRRPDMLESRVSRADAVAHSLCRGVRRHAAFGALRGDVRPPGQRRFDLGASARPVPSSRASGWSSSSCRPDWSDPSCRASVPRHTLRAGSAQRRRAHAAGVAVHWPVLVLALAAARHRPGPDDADPVVGRRGPGYRASAGRRPRLAADRPAGGVVSIGPVVGGALFQHVGVGRAVRRRGRDRRGALALVLVPSACPDTVARRRVDRPTSAASRPGGNLLARLPAGRLRAMTDFSLDLNEDQLQLQKWVHDFAEDVIRPAAARVGRAGRVPVADRRRRRPRSGSTASTSWPTRSATRPA